MTNLLCHKQRCVWYLHGVINWLKHIHIVDLITFAKQVLSICRNAKQWTFFGFVKGSKKVIKTCWNYRLRCSFSVQWVCVCVWVKLIFWPFDAFLEVLLLTVAVEEYRLEKPTSAMTSPAGDLPHHVTASVSEDGMPLVRSRRLSRPIDLEVWRLSWCACAHTHTVPVRLLSTLYGASS